MPIRDPSYNRVSPANARAVDVAKEALKQIMPVQQRRYTNAFEVNGYDTLVYTRLQSGIPCSCMSASKALGTLLDEDGKMSQGKMNEMISGGMVFKVKRYGEREPDRDDLRSARSQIPKTRYDQQYDGLDSETQMEPPLNNKQGNLEDPFTKIAGDSNLEDMAGNLVNQNLDDAFINFDANALDAPDVSCGICFGTGYVGGFAVLGSWRQILTTQWQDIRLNPGGLIEPSRRPHFFHCHWAEFQTILPNGFYALDAIKVWNNSRLVSTATVLIDSNTANFHIVRLKCDGQSHTIRVEFSEATEWTHLELQIGLSDRMAKIDFPNLSQSTDVAKLDQTEDVTINASPMIPVLASRDVLIEHTFGKAFQVGNCNFWNDKYNNVLGWTATSRVIQPNEVLNLLPRRRKFGQTTTNPVRNLSNQP